jgi:hypothetical protein
LGCSGVRGTNLVKRRGTMEVTLKGTEVLVIRDILEDVIAKHTREIGAATKKMPEAGLKERIVLLKSILEKFPVELAAV